MSAAPIPCWCSTWAYEDREAAVRRFVEVLRPEEEVLRYLAIENDERIWTVAEVTGAARSLGVPAIADTLHHALNPGGLALEEALNLALPTWEARGVQPKLHLSSQDPEKRPRAHAYSWISGTGVRCSARSTGGRRT